MLYLSKQDKTTFINLRYYLRLITGVLPVVSHRRVAIPKDKVEMSYKSVPSVQVCSYQNKAKLKKKYYNAET